MSYPTQGLLEKVGQEVRALPGDLEFKAPQDVQVSLVALVLLDLPVTVTRTPASDTTLEVILSFSSSLSQTPSICQGFSISFKLYSNRYFQWVSFTNNCVILQYA